MEDILDHLPESARVLDLGSRDGSFPAEAYRFCTIRVDISEAVGANGRLVCADAASLPFPARSFDAAILNHSLEHFADWKRAAQEVGRVIKSEGAVFVAVPDATTLADRLYRKVYRRAGGHVNLFDRPVELAKTLSWYFGLPHLATWTLYCSFPFLNRRNTTGPWLRRQMRFRGLPERPLALLTGGLRALDRRFHTRTSVYGWGLYFGRFPEVASLVPRTNVCIRCGQGHPSEWLAQLGMVRRRWPGIDYYRCPGCGVANVYTRDSDFS